MHDKNFWIGLAATVASGLILAFGAVGLLILLWDNPITLIVVSSGGLLGCFYLVWRMLGRTSHSENSRKF
jgi:hypothetical protein